MKRSVSIPRFVSIRRFAYAIAMGCALLFPSQASAHDIIGGGGAFLNGMIHPFVSIPHVLVLLGISLWLGKTSFRTGKQTPWWTFLVSLGLGLVLATLAIGFSQEAPLLLVAAGMGALLIWGGALPLWLDFTLALVCGFAMGLGFGGEEATSMMARNTGTMVSLYLAFLYFAMLGEASMKRAWQQIGLRVLGSWMAAAALLTLSLQLFVKR